MLEHLNTWQRKKKKITLECPENVKFTLCYPACHVTAVYKAEVEQHSSGYKGARRFETLLLDLEKQSVTEL